MNNITNIESQRQTRERPFTGSRYLSLSLSGVAVVAGDDGSQPTVIFDPASVPFIIDALLENLLPILDAEGSGYSQYSQAQLERVRGAFHGRNVVCARQEAQRLLQEAQTQTQTNDQGGKQQWGPMKKHTTEDA